MIVKRRQEKARPLFIGLGGTGVIGQALAGVLDRRGMDYVSLSLSPDSTVDGGLANVCIDLEKATAGQTEKALNAFADAKVAGVIDIIGTTGDAAKAVAAFVKWQDVPIAAISSCLLYDHDGTDKVDERRPSLPLASVSQPYIRAKLLLEDFWRNQTCEWVLIRTHHVLGRGSLLGCIPAHNRDPHLLERLASGTPLALARRGMVKLSYVHPSDLAAVVVELLLRQVGMNRVVNVVHPWPILARDYYAFLAGEIGAAFLEPADFDVNPADFWAATAKDNVYASNHPIVTGHKFENDIAACIRGALSVAQEDYLLLGSFMRRRIVGHDVRPQSVG